MGKFAILYKTLLTFLFFFLPFSLVAQELLPFLENFTKSDYNGDNQVWNIAQGGDKSLYFGNNHYFLRYDGVVWERYTLPNKTIIRSVMVDKDRVYTGSYNEFGYWTRVRGKMVYTSLTSKHRLFKKSDNEEIWKIFKFNGRLYFQTFNALIVRTNDDSYVKIPFPSQISYCYPVDGNLYIATVRNGVYEMNGNRFDKVTAWEALSGNVVHHIESYQGQVYVFTKNKGVFVGGTQGLQPWNHVLNQKLRENVILSAKFLKNNMLAVGTGLQGLYLINLSNGSFQNINRENGIKNNAVLSILEDSDNDIWLGLDNGIAHVEVNSPVAIFSDTSGILGSVYSIKPTRNGYIMVTNHGVYTYENKVLRTVPNSQGQVWDAFEHGDSYILGHNDGTYVYSDGVVRKVNDVNGGWKFIRSPFNDTYYQANYSGIAIYENINDLSDFKYFSSIRKPLRNLVQTNPGELWAIDYYKGFYRILFDSAYNVKKVENLGSLNGMSSIDYGVKLFAFRNEVLFLVKGIWYRYDAMVQKLVKDKIFNDSFSGISDIIPVDSESFIVEKSGVLYVINSDGNGFSWEYIPKEFYYGKVIFENTQAHRNGKAILINLDDGFISYSPGVKEYKNLDVTIEAFTKNRILPVNESVEFNLPLEVRVVSGYFGSRKPELHYKLDDSDKFIPVGSGRVILNNLHGGKHNFSLFYFNGSTYKLLREYSFRVDYPWFFSIWMICVYLFAIGMIFFLYHKWNQYRTQQRLQLKEEELKHQQEIFELGIKAENEMHLQKYEKNILELEIQNKASEVAGKSLSIAKQTELIDKIETILDNENNLARVKSQIKKAIKDNSVNRHEWASFESNLHQVHDDFTRKLRVKFPNLTAKDVKLCIYLRMNLSSKEIAPMMNISFRGVELHRYRLRKKLGISNEVNISKYMIDI